MNPYVTPGKNISRRIARRAVNKAQAFFEENDMIFQEVHQQNDNGKDAFLGLAWSGPDAGLIVWLQIKGGKKYKLIRKANRLRDMDPETDIRWPIINDSSEGRHVVHINPRLQQIWSNSRPIFIIVQDPDDEELYFGNSARMADLAMPSERKISLYPDVRLTPDGLDRFLESARAEAVMPMPHVPYTGGAIPTTIRYPDGTLGPSPIALEVTHRWDSFRSQLYCKGMPKPEREPRRSRMGVGLHRVCSGASLSTPPRACRQRKLVHRDHATRPRRCWISGHILVCPIMTVSASPSLVLPYFA
jgi:hypothetical protein